MKRGWQKLPSAQDEARALLDSLMGPKRDTKKKDNEVPETFKERNVCKRYLVGMCPNDWFKNTKREMDPCEKIHSDQLAEELRGHPDAKRLTAQYEEETLRFLEDICADADRWVAREKGNIRLPGKELQLNAVRQQLLQEKKETYDRLIESAERLGEEGGSAVGAEALAKAQEIKADIEEMEAKFTVETGGECVCEACGVRYPLGDLPHEIGDRKSHFSGKMHEAYSTIRGKVEELRKKKKSGDWDRLLADGKREGDRRAAESQPEGSKQRDRDRREDREPKDRRSRSREKKASKAAKSGGEEKAPPLRHRSRSRGRQKSRHKQSRSRSRRRR